MIYRDTYTVINVDRLIENVEYLYQHVKKDIMAVVKADAYGCGYKEVSKALHELPFIKVFAVATLKEAIKLRAVGITKDILVLGAIVKNVEDIKLAIEYDISLTVFSLEYARHLASSKAFDEKLKVHVKIDTGMNRIGLKTKQQYLEVIDLLKQTNFQIEGVFTHFACADESYQLYQQQKERFYEIIGNDQYRYIHCENSAAMLYHQDNDSNLCRAGIAMYGVDPAGNESQKLKQVLFLYTKVAMVKKVSQGEKIGYGYTYELPHDGYVATLPIGYGDGFIRQNQGRNVYINGQFFPIVGRVCMDQMMVLVDETIKVDDTVEIFGDHITLAMMAKELNTIPYEVMCLISKRVERVYQGKKKLSI